MSFGFGFGFPRNYVAALFTPGQLFTTGVNGAWYDPSDFSTMFQNAAGTTPVTAVGQPVGLMLDKSGRGNHAYNPSGNSANSPVLLARYNGLVSTENLTNPVWVLSGSATKTSNSVTVTASTSDFVYQTVGGFFGSIASGISITCSVELSGTGTIRLALLSGTGTAIGTQVISLTSTPTRYSVTTVNTATGLSVGIIIRSNGSANTVTVSKADLRLVNDALSQPAYQRVNTATDYDTAGFKPYLSFNGVNQWLQTNSIDFTYGDKMFVSAGVRKLGDALPATLAELSTNSSLNAGTFLFKAPQVTITGAYGFWSSGSLLGNALATGGSAAPITNVVSGIGNISGDQAMLRINGSQSSSSSGDQGSGNYGNYALYIGASAGTSLFFNGRLYGIVVAGKQASDSEIASTEAWLNQKTGAY